MSGEALRFGLRVAIDHAKERAADSYALGTQQFWKGRANGLELALRMLGEAGPDGCAQANEETGASGALPETGA